LIDKLLDFLKIFQLERTLEYPDLLSILDEMTERIVDSILRENEVYDLIKVIFGNLKGKDEFEKVDVHEFYLLRVISVLVVVKD